MNPSSSFHSLIIFVSLGIIGLFLLPFISVQLSPDRTPSSIHIHFTWPEASAKLVEQRITSVLEGVFNTINDVEQTRSMSFNGSGRITMDFKKGADMNAKRFEIASLIRLTYPKLPKGTSYPNLSISSVDESQSPILVYSISSTESSSNIQQYVETKIKPKISQINGISATHIYGAIPYQWQITYHALLIKELGISFREIKKSIIDYLSQDELGIIDYQMNDLEEMNELSVSLISNSSDSIDWNNIPIKKVDNRIILLENIATIEYKIGKPNNYYRINGQNTISLLIYAAKRTNTIKLSSNTKQIVNQVMATLDPSYEIKLIKDSSEYLSKEINKISLRSLFSLLFLLALIFLIYRNVTYFLTLFLGVVFNLLIAIILYYLLDIRLQLYSLAGITISFGIIIDNSIIMMDHMRNKNNKKIFRAILASVLTTIGAISVVLLLEESQRLDLWDFALVIAVNLSVSLFVSFYLIPSLMYRLGIWKKSSHLSLALLKSTVRLFRIYSHSITFLKKPIPKWIFFLSLLLAFGIPIHLLPSELKQENLLADVYHHTLGNDWLHSQVFQKIEKWVGGSLWLFTERVIDKSYRKTPERTQLNVSGIVSPMTELEQLNEGIKKVERLLDHYPEIDFYETQISSNRRAVIRIYFNEIHESGYFPFQLKKDIESFVLEIGSIGWSVSGVGKSFSNANFFDFKYEWIFLAGYDYDRLYGFAEELVEKIIEESNGRVRDIGISSNSFNTRVAEAEEFQLSFDKYQLALLDLSIPEVYFSLEDKWLSQSLPQIVHENQFQNVTLSSDLHESFDTWNLNHGPLSVNDTYFKIHDIGTMVKKESQENIRKVNQQFQLLISYNYLGPSDMGQRFKDRVTEEFMAYLPIGFGSPTRINYSWNAKDKDQYLYLFLIAMIIFFICAVLLESLKKPSIILGMIPISFIGVFLTFYIFKINFDQGGYASLILLCGISVNAALFIINDYLNLKGEFPNKASKVLYYKAFNQKIIPIVLTILSTIVGLIPFLWDGKNDVFWFSFAAGVIGGLVFSMIGVLFYLPLMMIRNEKNLKLN